MTLVALVSAPPAEEEPLAQVHAVEEKPEESTATSFLDELLSGIQTVAITEPVAEVSCCENLNTKQAKRALLYKTRIERIGATIFQQQFPVSDNWYRLSTQHED